MGIKLPAYLVHHTGSMIRFVTSQLVYLPTKDKYVYVMLPNGGKIRCKFHLHIANPYIAGEKLVHWIKGVVSFAQKKRVIVEIISEDEYFIYMKRRVNKSKKMREFHRKERNSIEQLLKKLLSISVKPPLIRRKMYSKILSKRVHSNLVKKVFGVNCQVENCEYTAEETEVSMKLISEVHHLEHLSRGGSNSPYNLAVLCSNHHAIFHRDKTAKIMRSSGDNVLVTYLNGKRKKWIVRDLSALHNTE